MFLVWDNGLFPYNFSTDDSAMTVAISWTKLQYRKKTYINSIHKFTYILTRKCSCIWKICYNSCFSTNIFKQKSLCYIIIDTVYKFCYKIFFPKISGVKCINHANPWYVISSAFNLGSKWIFSISKTFTLMAYALRAYAKMWL